MNAILSELPTTGPTPAPLAFGTEAAKWEAVCRRDPEADGHFLYSVKTTGVYCRPSCAARSPRRENVTFHLTARQAQDAGFRPCKRCRPDLPARTERETAMAAEACRAIDSAGDPLALAELAASAGMSPHHFHRLFKRVVGVTPKAYAAAQRQRRVQENLCSGVGVTQALYASGFNSSARFYESAPVALGMTPSAYRKGGEGETVWSAVRACSLGHVLVAATSRGVCAILLGDDPATLQGELEARFPKASMPARNRRSTSGWSKSSAWWMTPPGEKEWGCLWISGAPPFNAVCGKHCSGFHPARPLPTPKSRSIWAIRNQSGRWRPPAPQILWP